MTRERQPSTDPMMDLSRRQLLTGGLGGLGAVAAGVATYNVLLGYGALMGTNLLEQDLDPLVAATLGPVDGPLGVVDGATVRLEGGEIHASSEGRTVGVPATDVGAAATAEATLDLADGTLVDLAADLGDLDDGAVTFEYGDLGWFFDRLRRGSPRPLTVGALRGPRRADPGAVEAVTGTDPADTAATIHGLADGLREHTRYDLPRYAAGSVEDNVLLGIVDLRQHFESPTGFDAIAADEDSGLFCYELVFRSIEALHATPATEQSPPVFAGYVRNRRHKHAFTAVASVVRDGGRLAVPVTFVDYTRSTLYDDLRLRGVLGEGLDAYSDRQRATSIHWR